MSINQPNAITKRETEKLEAHDALCILASNLGLLETKAMIGLRNRAKSLHKNIEDRDIILEQYITQLDVLFSLSPVGNLIEGLIAYNLFLATFLRLFGREEYYRSKMREIFLQLDEHHKPKIKSQIEKIVFKSDGGLSS